MLQSTFLISMPGGSEWILILLVFPLYFLPTIIAASRKHPNVGGIVALNFFLGWTVLGWIGALIWAFAAPRSNASVIVNNTNQSTPSVALGSSTAAQDKLSQLKQLKQLLDDGTLTPEEFNKQKATILG